eukprot:5429746-Amphidinium_carterae.1
MSYWARLFTIDAITLATLIAIAATTLTTLIVNTVISIPIVMHSIARHFSADYCSTAIGTLLLEPHSIVSVLRKHARSKGIPFARSGF